MPERPEREAQGEPGDALLIDATDGPCPRCSRPLRAPATKEASVHECSACRGAFVDYTTLAGLVKREIDRRRDTPFAPALAQRPPRPVLSAAPGYVRCPVCNTMMERTNFGRRSGVIVDVCRPHGTWFDAGELAAALEFVAYGGLDDEHEARRGSPPAPARVPFAASRVAPAVSRPTVDLGSGVAADVATDVGVDLITGLFDILL